MKLFVVLFFSSLVVQAKPFKYMLTSYPNTVENCHKQAKKAGETFNMATGLKVISSICLKENLNRCDIEIIYESEEPVKRVSTALAGSIISNMGRYKNLKECESNIQAEVKLFEERTNLSAVFSYCLSENLDDKYPWFPVIESFGDAREYPYASDFYIFTVPKNVTYEDFKNGISKALSDQNAAFISFIVRSFLAYGIATVNYYSSQNIKFSLKEYTKTDTFEQCELQKKEIPFIYKDAFNKPAAVYCGQIAVGMDWELTILTVGIESLRLRDSLESFSKFSECEEKRHEIIRYYNEELKEDVKGGLCSKTASDYRVVLFEPVVLQ